MGIPLRVLIVEDVEDDAELLMQELRSKGYDPVYERVYNHKAMEDALARQEWDVVIADYSMPEFDGIKALKLLEKKQIDLPFILVSGTIGEDVAVEAMKAGAHDYVMKDNLSRFVPAIKRELAEYKERRCVKQMEEAIQTLVKGTVGVTGQSFFDRIVGSMCEWLGTDCAFIGTIVDESNVTALSMQLDGKITYGFSYSLTAEPTPCGNVVDKGFRAYTEGVCELFPNDKVLIEMGAESYVGISLRDDGGKPIGLLWTVSRDKLNLPPRIAEVMEIIAAKASAEIERKQLEDTIQTLVKSTVGVTGQDFFDRIVNSMCEWLGTDYAFIGNIEDGKTVRALSMKVDGKNISDYVYDLNGTPCENVVENDYCVYPEGVSGLFPNDKELINMKVEGYVGMTLKDKKSMVIGILWTASRRKINLPLRNEEVMEIIAAKASAEIERVQADEQIKKSLREKEVLLKEIHHRVKNNMQIVSSLLNLQSESIDDENIRQIFKKSQNRVKSMALVHEQLYQTKDLSSIDFGEYTRSLTARLLHSFGDNTNGVQIMMDIDEVYLDVNKAIPCGLIMNEIVTNSLKHAFPDSTTGADKNKFEGKGVIKVSMRKIADCELSPEDDPGASHRSDNHIVGQNADFKSEIRNPKSEIIELVISDNGIGLPEGLDFRNTKTLGMELINTLVDQLDGSIEYIKDKGGTEFKIIIGV